MKDLKLIVTHPGIFHADDVMAVAYLLSLVSVPVVRRAPTPEELADPQVACVDVGGQFDAKLSNFDHHQKGGAGVRWHNGVKYAAFGLVVENTMCHTDTKVNYYLDQNIVHPVDALDNGQKNVYGCPQDCPESQYGKQAEIPTLSFSSVISSYNPIGTCTPAERDAAFFRAVDMAKEVLANFVAAGEAWAQAYSVVRSAEVKDHVLVLSAFVPWVEHVFGHVQQAEILYVVFPSERGGFCIQQRPKTAGSFEGRKPLPVEWAGLREKALADLIGIRTGPSVFCHPGRFIGGAETLEDALKMAQLAITA